MEDRTELAARPESAGDARRFVASVLGRSHAEEVLETALLLTSEVVTNAVLHARTNMQVIVAVGPTRVRVEVWDKDDRRPEVRQTSEDDMAGRGIGLVETLSAAWGVQPREDGKCVWFEVTR